MQSFVNYLKEVEHAIKYTDWRAGQAYYNVLYDVRPDISAKLCGTDVDPFYSNAKIPVFLHHVAAMWETNES